MLKIVLLSFLTFYWRNQFGRGGIIEKASQFKKDLNSLTIKSVFHYSDKFLDFQTWVTLGGLFELVKVDGLISTVGVSQSSSSSDSSSSQRLSSSPLVLCAIIGTLTKLRLLKFESCKLDGGWFAAVRLGYISSGSPAMDRLKSDKES